MNVVYHKDLLKILKKLFKKDNSLYLQIISKLKEIQNSKDINHYKNLKKPLQNFKRVHISDKFVLIFKYIKTEDLLIFRYFEHRDKVYKKNYD